MEKEERCISHRALLHSRNLKSHQVAKAQLGSLCFMLLAPIPRFATVDQITLSRLSFL